MKIRIGVSACLLGRNVRYDGGHKLDPFIADTLGRQFEFVPVCPEAEAGLGIPREPMRLAGDPASPRLVTVNTGIDHTDLMEGWARKRAGELESEGLKGFIFKARSPSCGMAVDVFAGDGQSSGIGAGLFEKAFTERFPGLPVTDEGVLQDAGLRDDFLVKVARMTR